MGQKRNENCSVGATESVFITASWNNPIWGYVGVAPFQVAFPRALIPGLKAWAIGL